MLIATQAPRLEGTIMVVDDNPANLKLLEDMLCQKHCVRSFPRGRLAFAAALEDPPDLILLDVNMPEMNGYEMCKRLKSTSKVSEIPVLFISAQAGAEDKLEGFTSGGVDYISKPFQFEEVHARVDTHLRLWRARRDVQRLLEQTLNGTIRMLSELIQAASPELAARSHGIRSCVTWLAQQMGVGETWQFDLAATLSLLGCITLPEEIFCRVYSGESPSPGENAMFREHPESAARLLVNVPRLEAVAEIIRLQMTPDLSPNLSADISLGAQMLRLAVALDRRMFRGLPYADALEQLRSQPAKFDPKMLAALGSYSPASCEFHRQALPLSQLFVGMILEEDVNSLKNGMLILQRRTILSETWLERLRNFARTHGIREPIWVRVPGPECLPAPPKPTEAARRDSGVNRR